MSKTLRADTQVGPYRWHYLVNKRILQAISNRFFVLLTEVKDLNQLKR